MSLGWVTFLLNWWSWPGHCALERESVVELVLELFVLIVYAMMDDNGRDETKASRWTWHWADWGETRGEVPRTASLFPLISTAWSASHLDLVSGPFPCRAWVTGRVQWWTQCLITDLCALPSVEARSCLLLDERRWKQGQPSQEFQSLHWGSGFRRRSRQALEYKGNTKIQVVFEAVPEREAERLANVMEYLILSAAWCLHPPD